MYTTICVVPLANYPVLCKYGREKYGVGTNGQARRKSVVRVVFLALFSSFLTQYFCLLARHTIFRGLIFSCEGEASAGCSGGLLPYAVWLISSGSAGRGRSGRREWSAFSFSPCAFFLWDKKSSAQKNWGTRHKTEHHSKTQATTMNGPPVLCEDGRRDTRDQPAASHALYFRPHIRNPKRKHNVPTCPVLVHFHSPGF